MKSEHFEQVKKELVVLAFIAGMLILFLKVAFYNESILVVVRMALSLIWLFLLPGYSILLWWMGEINLLERLVMGSLISAGIVGIGSYYVGLLGLHVNFHTVFIPLGIILFGIVIWMQKRDDNPII